MASLEIESPLGALTIRAEAGSVVQLDWGGAPRRDGPGAPVLHEAAAQLRDYFDRRRTAFDLALAPPGDAFRQDFYAVLCAIPFGQTRTYGDLARDLGVPAQAIGQACGANPIPILIPCHRVLSATGLGGYSGAGGIEAKVALLKLEGAVSLLL